LSLQISNDLLKQAFSSKEQYLQKVRCFFNIFINIINKHQSTIKEKQVKKVLYNCINKDERALLLENLSAPEPCTNFTNIAELFPQKLNLISRCDTAKEKNKSDNIDLEKLDNILDLTGELYPEDEVEYVKLALSQKQIVFNFLKTLREYEIKAITKRKLQGKLRQRLYTLK
jgi:hypothetical protein